ncbi:MAG: thiamine phosphate synthase [Xanthomonadales bacterium]|nr:thiamine phosphate synthase [Xanthomonadales bacterium]
MRSPTRSTARGVYAITPDESDDERLLARCEAVLAGGVRWLQYRNKAASMATRARQATQLLPLCRSRGVALIINDDLDIATAVGADGVHLGLGDGSIAAARAALGVDAIIGSTCHNRLDLAERAAAEGASYVAFGAFFPSPTKPGAVQATPELLALSQSLGLPRVAIGGINADNARLLIDAGADLIAAISAIFDADDPQAATRQLAHLF